MLIAASFPAVAGAYADVLAPDRLDDVARYHRAVERMRAGDHSAAAALLEAFLLADPDSPRAPAATFLLGVACLRTGRLEEAERHLKAALERFPDLGDLVLLYLARTYEARGEVAAAAGTLGSILGAYPTTPAREEIEEEIARCLLQLERYDGAYLALQAILAARPQHPDATRLQFLAAQALEKAGRPEQSLPLYWEILHERPIALESAAAKERYDEIFFGKVEVLTSPLWLDITREWATRLEAAGESDEAARVRRAIVEFLDRNRYPASDRRQARRDLAMALLKARDHEASLALFDELLGAGEFPDRREILYWKARTLGRLGREEEAVPILGTLATGPKDDAFTQLALFHRALMLFERRDFASAAAGFAEYLARYPTGERSTRARWYLGWCAFRRGRSDEAIGHFARLAGRDTAGELARQARYWTARAHLQAGRRSEGVKALREIYDAAPLTYYGFAAYNALTRLGVAVPSPAGRIRPTGAGQPPLPPFDHLSLRKEPYFPLLARAVQLLDLGLTDDAARELDLAWSLGPRGARTRVEFARLFYQVGRYHRALTIAHAERAFLDRYRTTTGYDRLTLTYPLAYRSTVETCAAQARLPPALVWSVMRQESRFNPEARSAAGAVGLMQIIPRTAARIAAELGDADYSPQALSDPARSIRYGTIYLRRLMDRYQERAPLAVAAYNAGEETVDRWIRGMGDEPLEYFIEEIPYAETRAYVKEVSANLTLYGLIHGSR